MSEQNPYVLEALSRIYGTLTGSYVHEVCFTARATSIFHRTLTVKLLF